jgi:hypothetical protein
MRQQSGSLQNRKDKLKKSAYTLAAAAFCTIGLVYAWFSNGDAPMKFDSMTFAAGRTGLIMTNYRQTDTLDTEISLSNAKKHTYEKINGEYGGFDINAAPGYVIYFKTTVINRTADNVIISLYLGNIGCSEALEGNIKLACTTSDPEGSGETLNIVSITAAENDILPSSVRIADDIEVPGNGGTVGWKDIYWCIQIDGDSLGEECQNAQISIGQMYMEIEK